MRGGLTWADRSAYCQVDIPSPQLQQALSFWRSNCVTPLSEIYVILAMQIVGYLLLAVYIDNIMPDENGTKKPFWYLLQPSYWFPSKVRSAAISSTILNDTSINQFVLMQRPNMKRTKAALDILNATEGQPDIDVKAEQEEMKARCEAYIKRNGGTGKEDRKFAIEMYGLRKTYKRGNLFRKSKIFTAVAGNCYGIRQGK